MKVVIHGSTDSQQSLESLINTARLRYIKSYVDALSCSSQQKQRLLDSVSQTLHNDARR